MSYKIFGGQKMYQIKRMFTRHIEENIVKYVLLLSIFAVGIATGLFFSQNVSEDLSENLTQEIEVLLEGFSEGNTDNLVILKTSFLKNLRICFLLFVSGLSAFLLPVTFFTIISYGFSIGFTTGYLSFCFGGTGLAVSIVSVVFSFIINIPMYICLSVLAINSCKCKKHKGENLTSYIIVFLFLFLVSLISVVVDAFITPWLIGLICS